MSVTKGTTSKIETLEQEITFADNNTMIVKFIGDYATLKDDMPSPGDNMDDYDGWQVASCNLSRTPGGRGVLTVNCIEEETTVTTPDGLQKTRVHLSVREMDKPLGFGTIGKLGSSIDWCLLEVWRNEPDYALKSELKCKVPVLYGSDGIFMTDWEEKELGELDKPIALRILAGQEGYRYFYPVIIVEEKWVKKPKLKDVPRVCGASSSLPANHIPEFDLPSGSWLFMRCAVEVRQEAESLWNVTYEYMGALPPDSGTPQATAWGEGKAFDPHYYAN